MPKASLAMENDQLTQPDKHITIVSAKRPGILSAWSALFKYRGLYVYLFKQTAIRRFRDTILGPAWLLLRPLIPSVIAVIVFTRIVPISTGDAPYPIFYFSGYLLWGLFAGIVAFVPRAMRMSRGMMKKMYFPRILVPLASLGIPLAELAMTLCVFAVLTSYFVFHGSFTYVFSAQILLFPLLICLTILFAIAVGMAVGVLSLVARDVLYTLPYVLQVWMLLTPVIYGVNFVPEKWRGLIYILNPMASIVEAAKWSLLDIGDLNIFYLVIAAAVIAACAVLSTMFFLRAEDIFMDDI